MSRIWFFISYDNNLLQIICPKKSLTVSFFNLFDLKFKLSVDHIYFLLNHTSLIDWVSHLLSPTWLMVSLSVLTEIPPNLQFAVQYKREIRKWLSFNLTHFNYSQFVHASVCIVIRDEKWLRKANRFCTLFLMISD